MAAASGLAATGCRADVKFDFTCEDEQGSYEFDARFARGCNECVCNPDGTITCSQEVCCEWEDGTIASGTSVSSPDTCQECTCVDDGTLICQVTSDCRCAGEPGWCEPPPGDCSAQPYCDETGQWSCEIYCQCEDTPPACPAPPDGCYFEGPVCDGTAWSCGELVCPCIEDPPTCGVPDDPTCWEEAQCTEMGWECTVRCIEPCDGPQPECGPNEVPECTEDGWICLSVNQTCPSPQPVCEPTLPECAVYPVCHADGEWVCQEDCDAALCTGAEPVCPVWTQDCSYYPVCTTMEWTCLENCR